MAKQVSSVELSSRISRLLEDRQRHSDAIVMIDETLEKVNSALGIKPLGRPGRKPGFKMPAAASAAESAPSGGKVRRRRRGKFKTSGEDSVLTFVKEKGNPTGREIEAHWKSEGRGGPAANTLSKLAKEKRLKRIPLDGERGSRYSIG